MEVDLGSGDHTGKGAPSEPVLRAIIGIVGEMLEDWGSKADAIGQDSLLAGDLAFASVDLIHLVVAIEEHFGQGRLNFQDLLIKDGRYVEDLSIGDIAGFVAGRLR